MLSIFNFFFLHFLLLTAAAGSGRSRGTLHLHHRLILIKYILLDDLDLRSLSIAELLHVLLLGQLVTHLQVPLEVHTFSLTDSAGVDLPLR